MKSREEIMARVLQDAEFRAQLKSDPKGTLERELDTTLPRDLKIEVFEETPDQLYLVLPALGSKELTNEELTAIAAGGLGGGYGSGGIGGVGGMIGGLGGISGAGQIGGVTGGGLGGAPGWHGGGQSDG